MTQISFRQQYEVAEGLKPMTIIEYTESPLRTELSKYAARLNKSWNTLADCTSDIPTTAEQTRLDLQNKEGARLYHKFCKDSLPYKTRILDTIAKMLDMLKPCGTVCIDLQNQQILMSFNETLYDKREDVIRSKWNQIIKANQCTSKDKITIKLEVLSEILYMQEYKIVDRYNHLAFVFNTKVEESKMIIVDDPIFLESLQFLLQALEEYNLFIQKYRNNFNKSVDFFPSHSDLALALDKLIISSKLDMQEDLFKANINQNELSIVFLKMDYLFMHLIDIVHTKYPQEVASLLLQYEECDKIFCKTLDDVHKVTGGLHILDPNIHSFKIIFLDNPYKIHAELCMLEYRIKTIYEDWASGKLLSLEGIKLFDNNLGVSKLSCVQCHMTYKFAGLEHVIRGGHGILFINQWNFPQHWEMEKDGQILLEYLVNEIERFVYQKPGLIYDRGFIEYNQFSADMSDDENLTPQHMTEDKFKNFSSNILKTFLSNDEKVTTLLQASSPSDSGLGPSGCNNITPSEESNRDTNESVSVEFEQILSPVLSENTFQELEDVPSVGHSSCCSCSIV